MTHHPKSPPTFPYPWSSDWGEDQYGLWMGLDYKGVHAVFRWIEPGSFMMGTPQGEEGSYGDEDHHLVTLTKGFWLAETTVTQALWKAVTGNTPSRFEGDNLPVEQVSRDDSQTFLSKINDFHPELNLRLPWEAEWEYACRAGTETAFNFGKELSLKQANYRGVWKLELGEDKEKWGEEASSHWSEDAKKQTVPVKSYSCNAWGLYEMHGNVCEWCQDHWQGSLGTEAVINPQHELTEPEAGAERVVRGGSWDGFGGGARSACRGRGSPVGHHDSLGLRLSFGHPSASSDGGSV